MLNPTRVERLMLPHHDPLPFGSSEDATPGAKVGGVMNALLIHLDHELPPIGDTMISMDMKFDFATRARRGSRAGEPSPVRFSPMTRFTA